MFATLQIATFGEFASWLFGAVFCALMGLFWYWVSHSISEMSKSIKELNALINSLEVSRVRQEEQLAALRKDISQYVDWQHKMYFDKKKGGQHGDGESDR